MACTPATIKSKQLTIRYKAADDGTRPINPCDDTNPFYLSPALQLSGGIDAGTAKVGVDNTINVIVTNTEQTAIGDINVQVWVCDFTAGVSPASGLASAGGSTPILGFQGTAVNPGQSVTIACAPPWKPTTADAALNGGHVCLAANCFVDTGEGTQIPPGSFAFCCDCHHAQRNIAILVNAPRKRVDFQFSVANPDQENELVAVVAGRVTPPQNTLGLAERQLLIGRGLVENGEDLPNIFELREPGVPFDTRELVRATEELLRAQLMLAGVQSEGRPVPIEPTTLSPATFELVRAKSDGGDDEDEDEEWDDDDDGPRCKLTLGPGEKKLFTLRVQLDDDAPIGSVQGFDIVQTSSRGDLIGGIKVVAIVKP